MARSSDEDEEFFDAEGDTPRAAVSKTESYIEKERKLQKENEDSIKTQLLSRIEDIKDDVDLTTEKNIKYGRRKFRELRQYMQTEDDDCGASVNSTPESQTSSAEGVFLGISKIAHPFRVVDSDTMSIHSLTSHGRSGRIAIQTEPGSQSLGRDNIFPTSFNTNKGNEILASIESTIEEDIPASNNLVIPMQEPDVIASTKANSLRHTRMSGSEQSIVTMSRVSAEMDTISQPQLPIAPPRKKKKSKVSATQSLGSPNDDDMISLDSVKLNIRPTSIQNLNIVAPSLNEILDSGVPSLPSPASTIESLTRELQHSLDISNSVDKKAFSIPKEIVETDYVIGEHDAFSHDNFHSSLNKLNKSETSSRSSTIKSVHSQQSGSASIKGHSLDIQSATKGQYVVKPQDDHKVKAAGPTKEDLERIELLNELFNSGKVIPHNKIFTGSIGHSSLGAPHRSPYGLKNNSKERRKSAGDEDLLKQLNMSVRTRTDSGKQLTDLEILEQVTVLNLDTGERVPLSIAEDKLPQCINPLSLHIMRLTSEYVSNSSIYDDDKQRESDDDGASVGTCSTVRIDDLITKGTAVSEGPDDQPPGPIRRRTAKLKRFLGSTVKKTMDKAKSIAQEVSHARHREDVADIIDEVRGEQTIKLKASNSHKGPYDLDGSVRHVQEFAGEHVGPVWCMKFSQCGRLLATAGQDKVLRIWVIRDAYSFFQDMRTKYNADQKSSPTPSQESLASHHSIHIPESPNLSPNHNESPSTPFMPRPFCTYSGHTSDLLDVSWSKNYFILSSSMDKTVRLWHISRKECLCCFLHIDFVTAIVFHPRDDRYFLSGSLDGKLRLWNIPDKKVAVWNEVNGQTKLITAANFCQNGKFAVVGSYDGRCIFYTTEQLKYHTQIDVRSTRGKNSTGRKISGIEPMPGEDKILVTSNDSRIRLYDLRDLNLSCKYKGYVNVSSQIKASFSHDGKYIVSGSENQCIYIWKTLHDYSKFSSVRRDRNDFWEGIKAHNAVVTCAVFAPNPDNVIRMIQERELAAKNTKESSDNAGKVDEPIVEQHNLGHVLVSADFNGCIKVFINKTKPKHSSLPASALIIKN